MTQQEQPGEGNAIASAPHPKLEELIAVLELLRAPGGCAWDREQTHESLVRYLVEETYELIDAIESGNREEMIEELGDVLYQVIFHSDIAAHTPGEEFTLEDVAAHMTAKMIGRHPHVFGDARAETAADVNAVWDELKKVEKPGRTSTLDGVPQGMPALALADKLLGKAVKLGMLDAPEPAPGSEPGRTPSQDSAEGSGAETSILAPQTEDELGSLLLAVVANARAVGLDAERALRSTLRAFQDEMREAEQTG
jgi:XTP/dITP diphosphohydrolase